MGVPRAIVTGSLVALAGCAPAPQAPLLHEVALFHGRVELHSGGSRQTVSGELLVDRQRGEMQLTQRGDVTEAVLRRSDGTVRVFRDGTPITAAAAPALMADFARIRAVVEGPPGVLIARDRDGYRWRTADGDEGRLRIVEVLPRHGHGAGRMGGR